MGSSSGSGSGASSGGGSNSGTSGGDAAAGDASPFDASFEGGSGDGAPSEGDSAGSDSAGGDSATPDGEGGPSACTADPLEDATCGGSLPAHFVRCVVPYAKPAACQSLSIGNVTDTYCCP